jgi:hypothetical protein
MITNERRERGEDFLVDHPMGKQEELREKLFEQPQPKAKQKDLGVPLVPWSSVVVPANATELQRLTCPSSDDLRLDQAAREGRLWLITG